MWSYLATTVSLAIAARTANAACTATINSLSDVSAASSCTTVNINGFTVPGGSGFTLSLASGTTVNLLGDVLFGNKSWAGPLFTISGTDITFNGNGHKFDGGGPFYWDGQGSNGGTTKPRPMLKIKISGTFKDLNVVNSPAQTFSVSNPAPLVISGINIDNSQGDQPNSQSDGDPAGHNTDGFDCSTTDLTIENSSIKNQDDCFTTNKGSNIVFTGNTCSGGHGISIGSISSDVTVSGIVITNNIIINNDQALRIKMDSDASGSTVSNVTYSGNTGTGLRKFGVLIDQSYPDTLGTPGTGVKLSGVNFVGATTSLTVNSGAEKVAVNCGSGACTGTWDWSSLKVSGGKDGPITGFSGITGFNQDSSTTTSTSTSKTTTTTTTTSKSSSSSSSSSTTKTTSTSTSTSTTKTSTSTTSTSSGAVASHYYQCGGIGYTGPTTCAAPYTCVYSNDYYSQCL